MSNDKNLTPSSILAPHIRAFDDSFSARMASIKLDAILVYLIDNIDASLLPYLAAQFDVSGFKGYLVAPTDAARRLVIKNAIQIKRYMGTLYAIKLALSSAGYGSEAVINEGVGFVGDGNDWARFSIDIDPGSGGPTITLTAEATRLINLYKNVRSELIGIAYPQADADTYIFWPLDETGDDLLLDADVGDDSESMELVGDVIYYDSALIADGSVNYGGSRHDIIDIQII